VNDSKRVEGVNLSVEQCEPSPIKCRECGYHGACAYYLRVIEGVQHHG